MPRNQLSATSLVLIATLLVGPISPAPDETTRAAVASWLASNAPVILVVLGAWIGLAIIIGAVWALTYGRARRPHRAERPGPALGQLREDEGPGNDEE
ncbi:hypothetical protein [Phytoactinopolyspora mesophila]|uniref:Uncharacterized protein n=1 Tax=Phytoactinopolyspora mesophila TaxID=2650750 RepID=A0A7K3M0V3_9ACTN|nr:hypothetical protein [Phytoactinopolyspora mesophila]NDL56904.1 hypothetical protein [Phytoactinopolyspora mesophila]